MSGTSRFRQSTGGAAVNAAVRPDGSPVPAERLRSKDMLEIETLTPGEIQLVLETADSLKDVALHPVKKIPALRGRTVVNLFYEASTRTRTSFELAAARVSADVVNINVQASSVSKGETLLDTARTLEAMSVDFIVMRHGASGAPGMLARNLKASVVNGGDGQHEHPTQALLDLYTVREKLGRIKGLTIAIVGDILHSRVARSNVKAFAKMGAKVRLVGPPLMLPPEFKEMGAEVHYELEPALKDADIIYVLRLQLERHKTGILPSVKGYTKAYQINPASAKLAKPNALIMHPGPMNRGVEISHESADGPQSVIVDQVTNGVAIRMAVLYLLEIARQGGAQTGGEA